MTIKASINAPSWGQDLAKDTQQAIDALPQPFISRKPYTVAQLTAALAILNPYKLAIVTDGAANKLVAVSDGAIFRYMDGVAV